MAQRGNIDLDQIQGGLLSGTTTLTQIVTVLLGSSFPGTVPVWDTDGNLSGISSPLGGVLIFPPGTTYEIQVSDAGKLLFFNSSLPSSLTLPSTPPSAAWTVTVANIGSGAVTISPPAGRRLNGSTDPITISSGGVTIYTDGFGNYYGATGTAVANNTHSELLTDGDGNLILAAGDVIYVVGVPN